MHKSIAIGILWVGTAAVLSSCSEKGAQQSPPAARSAVHHSAPQPDRPRGVNRPAAGAPAALDLALSPVGAATRARPADVALTTPLVPDDTAGAWADELHAAKDQAVRSQGAVRIWAQWDEVRSRGNPREVGILLAALGDALRAPGGAAVYDGIAARLADPGTQADEIDSLVQVLQQAATPRSLGLLLDALNRAPEPGADGTQDGAIAQVRETMRGAIGAITSGADGRGPNWALSPVLEDAWKTRGPGSPIEGQLMIGQGLAAVGAPSGIAALLERAGDPAADPLAQQIAYDALGRVTSSDPIPVMQEALRRPDADPRLRQAVWNGLISIGAADAATVLLNDLSSGSGLPDDQLTQLGEAMMSRGFPDESRKVFSDALSSGQVADERLRTLLTALTQAPAQSATDGQGGNGVGNGGGKQGS